ncbi:MAG TPA: SUMF1/EgtB/PvdO family nonheme iron enzyme [Anaerolineales bacterium]|nr:SUMF1/EgtB/PvdO family nonheme iron enzyme [Anaerolineales bacterium]
MRNYFLIFLFIFLLTACAGNTTEAPIISPTSTQTPTLEPTAIPPTLAVATSTTVPTEEATTHRISPIDGMPQVYIPVGTFRMGGLDIRHAPDEAPAHDVTIDAFWMDQLEVTNAMYQLCVKAGKCTPPQNFASQRRNDYYQNVEFKDYPVIYVTWAQANAYCEWVGRRLPTEAEWERAARGDDFRTFPWGEDKPDERFANFNFIVKDTSRVGSYPLGASPFGVLDMAGNVAEWTNDLYKYDYYKSSIETNPQGPLTSSSLNRVVRGGSLGDAEINIRVSKRSSVLGSNLTAQKGSPEYYGDFSPRIGFRCMQDD